ncbi:uncharacterized protein BXZ73DRAFT_78457 [Epithele typhae]|uniref:uncharacterized protein n=1 Tax=Epithele typhae TaxID=378194 RepID=UPI0020087E30|nr:uncharacterized protein BXZ73DRAFT_78457 [Epithele typhae]KAH9928019.1 hypothetical protein BXZ73DRAFT_78457 [Epithele typhae]
MPSSPLPVERWEDIIDALAAAHEFESVAVCARLASVRHALECTPQLRGLVASVHLHILPAPRQDSALFNSAPVVLLPYLPCVESWRFEAFWAPFSMPRFRWFSRFSMACFGQYSSIKTLDIKEVQLATPLHLHRLVACFPKLQVLRLAAVKFEQIAEEFPLLSSCRLSIASLRELREDLHVGQQLQPLYQASSTTLTHLTLPCYRLRSHSEDAFTVCGLVEYDFHHYLTDVGEMTRLRYLSLRCDRRKTVLSSCIDAVDNVNTLLRHGLPSSLLAFEVVYPEACCPPQEGYANISASSLAAQLAEDLGPLRKIGATCIFEDVKENHVEGCTSVVQQAFLPLHSLNLLRVFRTFTCQSLAPLRWWVELTHFIDPPVKGFHGHTGYVERLVLSPSGAWAASVARCNPFGWSFNFIIWNTESQKPALQQSYDDFSVDVFSVTFAPTETLCACTTPSSEVDIFRLPSRSEVAAGQRVRKVGCFKVGDDDHIGHAWRPDGTQLVALTRLGRLEVWDTVTLTLVQSFSSPSHILPQVIRIQHHAMYDTSFIKISDDGHFVLRVSMLTLKDGTNRRCILVHDLVTGVCHSPFSSPDAPTPRWFTPVIQAVLRRDPARPHVQQVAVVREDAPIVMLADAATDSSLGGPVSLVLDVEPTQPSRRILFDISAHGNRVLHTHGTTVSTTYSVFDVGTGRTVASVSFKNALQGNRRGVLSPDGRHGVLLALSYVRYKMWLWHVDEGTLHRIQGTMGCREWTTASFSGDGATLGLGYPDGTVSFHNVQDIVRGQAYC